MQVNIIVVTTLEQMYTCICIHLISKATIKSKLTASHIRVCQDGGKNLLLAAGNTPMSCSSGLNCQNSKFVSYSMVWFRMYCDDVQLMVIHKFLISSTEQSFTTSPTPLQHLHLLQLILESVTYKSVYLLSHLEQLVFKKNYVYVFTEYK